jgi:hypothetical protein
MRRLIIGPGSMILYAFIGALKYLGDSELLNDLEEMSCSSAGSILGFFYVFFKGDVNKLLQVALEAPLEIIAKPDIKSLLTKFGLIDGDRFEKYMVKMCDGFSPTFKELYEMNPIKLHIPTCDIVANKTIYMSVDTTPDMKVAHAVRRSIAVPVIITPVSRRYVDGSIKEFSPFGPFLGKTDVLEIRFRYEGHNTTKPLTFFQYLYTVVCTFISNRVEFLDFPRIELFTGPDFQLFNFSMSLEQKLQLYTDGYHQAKKSLPACYRKSRDPYSEGPKSPACSDQTNTRDQGPQSEDPRHPVDDETDEKTDHYESSSPVPQEMYQSSGGTSESFFGSNADL